MNVHMLECDNKTILPPCKTFSCSQKQFYESNEDFLYESRN